MIRLKSASKAAAPRAWSFYTSINKKTKVRFGKTSTCSIFNSSNENPATTHRHTHQSVLRQIDPRHLFQIINDVDQYQHFLPYCSESKILQKSQCGSMYDAVLRVGLPGLTSSSSSMLEERYVSRVRMTESDGTKLDTHQSNYDRDKNLPTPTWIVEAKSIQSKLFHSLKSRWLLTPVWQDGNQNQLDDGSPSCNVEFEVEIQVSNPLISFTLEKVLKDVAKKQVLAFERRCREVPFAGKVFLQQCQS